MSRNELAEAVIENAYEGVHALRSVYTGAARQQPAYSPEYNALKDMAEALTVVLERLDDARSRA